MKKDLEDHLFGPSSFFMWDNHAKKQQFPFFQSFQSVADFGSRTASIITAPILSAGIFSRHTNRLMLATLHLQVGPRSPVRYCFSFSTHE